MITDLKPYAVMKHSGVEWLGSFPEHWELRRTKRLLAERSEKGCPDESLLAATQTQGVVRKEQYENRTVLALKDLQLLKIVRVGDFVISLRSFQGGIEFAREQGIISPAYTILYPFERDHHAYLAKVFKSRPYIENLSLFVKGIRQGQNIDYEKLARSCLPLPPLSEQIAIVRFLDHADRRIRRYIRAKQKMIALLEEQKQAMIHEAVTGQIDVRTGQPYPAYKASGVEWLGAVPEHWQIRKLGQIARVFNGATPSRAQPSFWENGTVPWLNSSKVNEQVVVEPSELVTERAVRECSISLAPSGAVVVGLVGQGRTRGMSALLGIDTTISQNLAAIVPSTAVDGNFLHCLLTALYLNVRNIGRGGNQEALNCDLVSRLRLPIPPLVEQVEMLRHIDGTLSKSAESIKKVSRETDLVREYRTRLIADVVTGRLDVREAAEALPEVDPLAAEDDLDDTGDPDGGPKPDNEEQVSELEH